MLKPPSVPGKSNNRLKSLDARHCAQKVKNYELGEEEKKERNQRKNCRTLTFAKLLARASRWRAASCARSARVLPTGLLSPPKSASRPCSALLKLRALRLPRDERLDLQHLRFADYD